MFRHQAWRLEWLTLYLESLYSESQTTSHGSSSRIIGKYLITSGDTGDTFLPCSLATFGGVYAWHPWGDTPLNYLGGA